MNSQLELLRETIKRAAAEAKVILIKGGNTKAFYGNTVARDEDNAVELEMATLTGVINYEPTELVITAWAGTPLQTIKDQLDAAGQMFAFDPPSFGAGASLGGMVAAGLSGPLRHGAGPLKDFVLGAHLLDAEGKLLKFGGEVMKNVAGYDVSRLLTGSLGMFGPLTQISVKVAPKPLEVATLQFELDEQAALDKCLSWRAQPLPISATATTQEGLFVRLAGAPSAVQSAITKLGGTRVADQTASLFWDGLREHTHDFFKSNAQSQSTQGLWRFAVAPHTPALGLGPTLTEWGGGQRWIKSDQPAAKLREIAASAGGHATLFRSGSGQSNPADGVFQPLASGVSTIVRRLKQEFDPQGLFNPSRLVWGV